MYVLVGASGYLGGYFLKNLLQRNSGEKIIATYNSNPGKIADKRIEWMQLDISDFNSISKFANTLNKTKDKCMVFYLSAYHHPDKVKENFDVAWDINITGLSYFLTRVKNISTLYYSSTEMVYGESGSGEEKVETSECEPINLYGVQKKVAEQLVLGKGYNVIRYSILMGVGINGKKHFTDVIIDTISKKEKIEMLSDTYRNMIDYDQASELAIRLSEKYKSTQVGIVNIVGDDIVTKFDVATLIADHYGLGKQYIKPLEMQDNGFYTEKRAKLLLLSNKKVKKLLGIEKIKIRF